jgi:hypothetical protein
MVISRRRISVLITALVKCRSRGNQETLAF